MSTLKILYATDGSAAAADALSFLEALPLPNGTEVRALFVLGPPVPVSSGAFGEGLLLNADAMMLLEQQEEAFANKTLEGVQQRLQSKGLEVTPETEPGQAAHTILRVADEWQADLVVLGSKGLSGLTELLLGSTARNVAKHCRRPVLIAHAPRFGLQGAVLATDGSEHAKHAAAFAAALPLPEGARWTAVCVVRPHASTLGILDAGQPELDTTVVQLRRQQEEQAAAVAAEAQARLMEGARPARAEVRHGDPAAEIVKLAAERDADLIVCGARGVSLIEGLLVGSVADRLLKESQRSVLIVP